MARSRAARATLAVALLGSAGWGWWSGGRVAARFDATVVHVVDGDTIVVEVADRTETVRILGADTPETVDHRKPVQCYGPEASAHDLVSQKHPAMNEIGHHLGVAIGSLVNILNPELVAIGGGLGVAAFDLLLPAARPAVLREALAPGGERLEIGAAELGAEAGLIGAGLVAFDAAD